VKLYIENSPMNHKEIIESLNKYWKKNNIFKRSISSRPQSMQVVTFDGPPFASGTPHYGHALVSIMKDTLGRFKTMQ
jgi:isoleucyl-tRNA synthetase